MPTGYCSKTIEYDTMSIGYIETARPADTTESYEQVPDSDDEQVHAPYERLDIAAMAGAINVNLDNRFPVALPVHRVPISPNVLQKEFLARPEEAQRQFLEASSTASLDDTVVDMIVPSYFQEVGAQEAYGASPEIPDNAKDSLPRGALRRLLEFAFADYDADAGLTNDLLAEYGVVANDGDVAERGQTVLVQPQPIQSELLMSPPEHPRLRQRMWQSKDRLSERMRQTGSALVSPFITAGRWLHSHTSGPALQVGNRLVAEPAAASMKHLLDRLEGRAGPLNNPIEHKRTYVSVQAAIGALLVGAIVAKTPDAYHALASGGPRILSVPLPGTHNNPMFDSLNLKQYCKELKQTTISNLKNLTIMTGLLITSGFYAARHIDRLYGRLDKEHSINNKITSKMKTLITKATESEFFLNTFGPLQAKGEATNALEDRGDPQVSGASSSTHGDTDSTVMAELLTEPESNRVGIDVSSYLFTQHPVSFLS